MKSIITALLLLAAIAGMGQTGKFKIAHRHDTTYVQRAANQWALAGADTSTYEISGDGPYQNRPDGKNALIPYEFKGWIGSKEIQDTASYDTVMVIAEVYALPNLEILEPTELADTTKSGIIWIARGKRDSIWRSDLMDMRWQSHWPVVGTIKILAWDVMKTEYGDTWAGPMHFTTHYKYLAYNRKDELTNVLQTWRVKELENKQ